MSFTFWFTTWFVGALLVLGPAVHGPGRNSTLDEGTKAVVITLATVLWPLALVWGCLVTWAKIWTGK